MDSYENAVAGREDRQVNVKIKLSALWVALMLLYTYADILGFYTPGTIENLIAGKAGNVQITSGFLVVMAIWMTVPSLMIFLCLVVKAGVNRWLNIVLGVLSLLVLGLTFLAGEINLRYVIQAAVEAMLIGAIIWYALTWSKQGE